jgi:hypothetical protein
MPNTAQVLQFIGRRNGYVRVRELQIFPPALIQSLERSKLIKILKEGREWIVQSVSAFEKKEEINSKISRQEKVVEKLPKPIKGGKRKTAKARISPTKIKEKKPKVDIKAQVYSFILASEQGIFSKDILDAKICSKVTLHKYLNLLMEEGSVIADDKQKNRLYIDKDRAHLLVSTP